MRHDVETVLRALKLITVPFSSMSSVSIIPDAAARNNADLEVRGYLFCLFTEIPVYICWMRRGLARFLIGNVSKANVQSAAE